MERELRENASLPQEGWSYWVRAMVPDYDEDDEKREVNQHYEKRNDGQSGLTCTNIRKALPDYMKHCGIYEWKATGTRDDQPQDVVYVGSTCRGKPGALRGRILEYCRDGSHKEDEINDALKRGYELFVRVKTTNGRKKAEDMENKLLDKYDYAWNIRENGEARDILP